MMETHAGERIKEYLSSFGMSISEFARRLNCHRQNVYDIFKRRVVDIERLQQISKILEHDFFTELYGKRDNSTVTLELTTTVEVENGQCRVTKVISNK